MLVVIIVYKNVGKFGKNLTEIFKILVKWSAMS